MSARHEENLRRGRRGAATSTPQRPDRTCSGCGLPESDPDCLCRRPGSDVES